MRKLFLLQGAPGSGKSTFIEQHRLGPWTISSDTLRLLFRSPELHSNGHLTISCSEDREVWRSLHTMVATRLSKGDLTIVDATHTRPSEINAYHDVAMREGYETFLVTWRDQPLGDVLAKNAARDRLRWVPEPAVREAYARVNNCLIPDWVKVITPAEFSRAICDPAIDASAYERIHVLGALRGHADALESYFANGLVPDELYVFVGDNFLGGNAAAHVFLRLLEWSQLPNVRICQARSDRYLDAWSKGAKDESTRFDTLTGSQLSAAGISSIQARRLLGSLSDAVLIHWQGRRVLITHAGLPSMPEPDRLAFVPSHQMIEGVGGPDLDIDAQFALHAPEDAIQIHGLRNVAEHPTAAAHNSFNLHSSDEARLRVVVLASDGRIHTQEIPSLSSSSLDGSPHQ